MEELKIVKNYMDEFEFRNYVYTMLHKNGYSPITVDDERVSDETELNDNDLLATKDNKKFTVQTYLNTSITDKHIEETLKDMDKENVSYGLIVTNFTVNKEIKEKASKKHIIILDKSKFKDGIYD